VSSILIGRSILFNKLRRSFLFHIFQLNQFGAFGRRFCDLD